MLDFVQISFFLVSRKTNKIQLTDETFWPVNTENMISLLVIPILIINPQFPKSLFLSQQVYMIMVSTKVHGLV